MKQATLKDLKLELWLRLRESGNIYWTTKTGINIPIKDMDINHLLNTINMLERSYEAEEHIGDMDPMNY